jgi:hypothetical protein
MSFDIVSLRVLEVFYLSCIKRRPLIFSFYFQSVCLAVLHIVRAAIYIF